MRVIHVVAARPNFMKTAPIMAAMSRSPHRFEQILVHTGQHYDDNMSRVFFEDLEIPQPDYHLGVGSGSHAEQTARVMLAFEPLARDLRPELVLVVGDVNSTLACALVCAKLGVKVGHVEAGLRSFDRTMPEEINRIVTDHVCDMLFVSEPSGMENLRREGIPEEKIYFVGNVMIDTLFASLKKLDAHPPHPRPPFPYGIVTLHRPSNVDDSAALSHLLRMLEELSVELPLLFPVHPRTAARLKEFGLHGRLRWCESFASLEVRSGIHAGPPLGYLAFLNLMRGARLVITDSGGIQEETTALGIPCITLRDNTERPITVTMGTNYLVGARGEKLMAAFAEALSGGRRSAQVPPLWDGKTAERIVEVIVRENAKAHPRK